MEQVKSIEGNEEITGDKIFVYVFKPYKIETFLFIDKFSPDMLKESSRGFPGIVRDVGTENIVAIFNFGNWRIYTTVIFEIFLRDKNNQIKRFEFHPGLSYMINFFEYVQCEDFDDAETQYLNKLKAQLQEQKFDFFKWLRGKKGR